MGSGIKILYLLTGPIVFLWFVVCTVDLLVSSKRPSVVHYIFMHIVSKL